jgi:hypothetical protein
MRELISSMMRFSGAVTLFSIEQAQNVAAAPADTRAALAKLRQTLDEMSESLAAKLDDPKKAALESMSDAQAKVLEGAFDAVNLDAAGEFLQKTSESLSGAVSRPARKVSGAA